MDKHTPGPWFAVGAWVEIEDDDVPDICTCNPEDIGQEGRSDEEICANARLIAAAPDLLNALRLLYDCSSDAVKDSKRMLDNARINAMVAISNATGE
jgi:hypothetical protein